MPHRNVVRIFFYLSLGIAVALPLYNAFFIYPSFNKLLTENTEDEAVRVANHLASAFRLAGAPIEREMFSPEGTAKIEQLRRDLNLMKVKIFSPSGEVVYSTEHKEIGRINTEKYFHTILSRGKPYTNLVRKDRRSLEGEVVTADVVETYVPLLQGGTTLGAFELYYDITARKAQLDSLIVRSSTMLFVLAGSLLAALITGAQKERRVMRRLEDLADLDSLTNIFNRRKYFYVLEEEIERAKRYGRPLGLLMFDIDHFKRINDTCGHDKGDYVLTETVAVVKATIRGADVFVRYGGEEFAVISPETDLEGMQVLSERLRSAMEQSRFGLPEALGATHLRQDDTADTITKRADEALYKAKSAGRNAVEIAA